MAQPSNRNLYLAAAVSCLTAGLFGYSVGFIGGEIVLPSFLSRFHLNDLSPQELATARSWSVTTWITGALLGVPTAMPICSSLGRRLCLQFAGVMYVIGAVIQLYSSGNLLLFDVGRFINGMGVGAGTLVSPIYISEIAPASARGFLMSGYQVFVQSGALVGFWIAFVSQATISNDSALQWQLAVALQLFAGLFLLLGCLIIPESPRYLAEQGQHQAMEDSLAWLRRRDTNDPELIDERLELVETSKLNDQLKQHSFISELGRKNVRRRLVVGVGLMIAQNMAGLNALNYYAPVIFMSAGFTTVSASLFLAGVFGLVKLASALSFMFKFVYVKGNRFWLLLGSAICGASMLILACCVRATAQTTHQSTTISAIGVLSIMMVYVFTFAFGVSLGPISWNVCAEIFPLHINSTCCAITTCTQWVFQIVIAAITPPLLAAVGWATYVTYGVFCLCSLIWIALVVPETRGLGLGPPMDKLFGAQDSVSDEDTVVEVSETTALLVHDRRRRSSLMAYA